MPTRTSGTLILLLIALLAGLSVDARAGVGQLYGVTAVPSPSASELQQMQRGGVRSARIQFNWDLIEPTPGARNWETLDTLVADAALADVTLLPFLLGTPGWMSGSNIARPPLYSQADRAAWITFVGDLARRYGNNGAFWALHPELPSHPITSWQLWNEVNFNFFWGGRPNPRRYAELVRLTRRGLDSADRAAKIVLAGMVPFETVGPGTVSGSSYLRRFFRLKGMVKLVDAVAIHPYGSSPGRVLKALKSVRGLLKLLRVRAPIWVTEFGWSTGGPDFSRSPLRASPAQQARRVAKTYKLLKLQRKRLGIKRAFYFSFRDVDPLGSGDTWVQHMGLLTLDGSAKPAWIAYARSAGGQP